MASEEMEQWLRVVNLQSIPSRTQAPFSSLVGKARHKVLLKIGENARSDAAHIQHLPEMMHGDRVLMGFTLFDCTTLTHAPTAKH